MKKKLFAILGLFLMVSSTLIAQTETNVFWGKDNPLPSTGSIYLLGKRGNYILGYKKDGKNVSLIRYSYADLQVNGEADIIGKETKNSGKMISKDYTFDQIVILKDKNYVCVTEYDKPSKQNVLYMQEFDDNGDLQGGLKRIAAIDAKSKSNKGSFDFILSNDSTKFLLVNFPPDDKYATGKFGFQILDQNLNVVSNAQVTLPNNYKYLQIDNDEITLANDGMIYMLAKITEQKDAKVKGEAGFYFELFAINPKGSGDIVTYDVRLPQKAITDVSYILEDENIICSGFYGNVKGNQYSTGQIDGIFYFRINKATKAIETTGVKPLDKDFIADLTTQKNANKGKGISNNFTLLHFANRSDGGAVLVSEYRDFYWTEHYVNTGNGGGYWETVYHYIRNNIIVININPDGSIKWYVNIPKKQHTTNDDGIFSSFMLATKGDKMEFVYNDDPRNYDPSHPRETTKELKTMENPRKSSAILVELSDNGKFTKSPLFNSKESKSILTPGKALYIGDHQIIVPALQISTACCGIGGSTKYKLARFEFK